MQITKQFRQLHRYLFDVGIYGSGGRVVRVLSLDARKTIDKIGQRLERWSGKVLASPTGPG